MDSNERNESKIRRREETLARRMGQALDQLNPGGAGGCPDAEVIAAYAEQALAPAESTQWESHFATCARCRNILRVLAASTDTPLAEREVAHLGELVAAVQAPVEIMSGSTGRAHPKSAFFRRRWLAPAVGIAAVLAVWLAMRPPWRALDRGASPTLMAQAPREEVPVSPTPPVAEQFSKVEPQAQQDQKKETEPSPDRLSANAPLQNSPLRSPANESTDVATEKDKVSSSAGGAADALQERKKFSAMANGREVQTPAGPPPPPSSLKAQPAAPAPIAPPPAAKSSPEKATAQSTQADANAISSSSARDKQAATLQPQADAAAGAAAQQKTSSNPRSDTRNLQTFAAIRQTQNFSALLKAPSGSILWRAGRGGIIERSSDAGLAWAAQTSPSREDWIAGVAISDTACWLVGRNGAIARTVDGVRWERIVPPPRSAGPDGKLPDWTGVTASDSQSATITAGDGRKFSTADAGKTWQQQ